MNLPLTGVIHRRNQIVGVFFFFFFLFCQGWIFIVCRNVSSFHRIYSTPSFIIISFTSLLFFSLACFLACRDRSCFASWSSSPSFVDKSFSRCLTAFCLSEYCYYDIERERERERTIDDKWWEFGSFVSMWCEVSYVVRSIKIIIRVGEWQMSGRWWWSCACRDNRYACFMSSASQTIIIIISRIVRLRWQVNGKVTTVDFIFPLILKILLTIFERQR
jgi:hypothetical protein